MNRAQNAVYFRKDRTRLAPVGRLAVRLSYPECAALNASEVEQILREMTAGEWMRQNGHSWGEPKKSPKGKNAKYCSAKEKRDRYARNVRDEDRRTVREFVHSHRNRAQDDCIFVPASMEGRPARLDHCGRPISAARYMALLTMGAPKSSGMVVRHLCANGHLSCINPRHLAWGAPADNISDASKHRATGNSVKDKINAIT